MNDTEHLLAEMERFAKERGISPVTVGSVGAGDSKFYPRLKAGGQCLPKTSARVRAAMKNWKGRRPKEKSSEDVA